MTRPRRFSLLTSGAALLTSGLVIALGATSAAAATGVAAVTGRAFGYSGSGISLLGGTLHSYPASPAVSLNSSASNSPQSATAPSGSVIIGPGDLFTSGALAVRATGSLGAAGSVTASTSIATVNTTGAEPFTAASVIGSCKATTSGTSGSTTVSGGKVVTDTDVNGNATATSAVPANPTPNFTISGVVHPGGTSTDHFRYVFNEQSVSAGALIVNAVHVYLGPPLTTGSIIEGQVVCGVNGTGVAAATTSGARSASSGNIPGGGAALGTEGRVLSTTLVSVGVALIAAGLLPWRRPRRLRSDWKAAREPDDDLPDATA